MLILTKQQNLRALTILVSLHILIICASNYLVQLPFQVIGFHSTWGAFSFPFVYLATDLSVRVFGQNLAREIIFKAMFPALLISYVVSVIFQQGEFQGFAALSQFNNFVFRISLASFAAYLFGQLMDITVFAKLRANRTWWIAPLASTFVGNLVDTMIFFGLAFYKSSDTFMAENWLEIAGVDYSFKLIVSLVLFLPAYGVLLKVLAQKLILQPEKYSLT